MVDLREFHGRLKNYLTAPDSVQLQVYSMPKIIELFKKLTTLPKQTKSSPVIPFTNKLEEVQKIMKIHLDKEGVIYENFSIFFQEAPDQDQIIALLKKEGFNIVDNAEMKKHKGDSTYIAQSLLSKKEKILLKVLDVKFVQIRKIFSNEEVTSIIDLKRELGDFLSLEENMIYDQLQAIIQLIKVSPTALLEQYRLLDNGSKIDELIRIINKEYKISSNAELERKLEDIIPSTSEKAVILSDLMDKLRDCV